MSDQSNNPKFRHGKEVDLIPPKLLYAMGALVLSALAITSYAVVTDREPMAQPAPSNMVASRMLSVDSPDGRAVTLRDEKGDLIAEMENGGFIAVIYSGLSQVRHVARLPMDLPIRLERYENGRLVVRDPETGWSVELTSFGENKNTFERLLPE